MGRSSRILLLSLAFTASPALAQTRTPLVRVPAIVRAPAMVQPQRFAPRLPAPRFTPPRVVSPRLAGVGAGVARPTFVYRPGFVRRPLRPNLASGYGFGEVGILGIPDLSLDPAPLPGPVPADEPGLPAAAPLPPPVCPEIIKIGRGIRHAAKTKVVYGPAVGCVRYPRTR